MGDRPGDKFMHDMLSADNNSIFVDLDYFNHIVCAYIPTNLFEQKNYNNNNYTNFNSC